MSTYSIAVKFKLTSLTASSLFEIYGNISTTANNYIKIGSNSSGGLTIAINNTAAIIAATSANGTLATNIWYTL